VKDPSGRKALIEPLDLPLDVFEKWLRQQGYAGAKALVLGLPWPRQDRDTLEEAIALDEAPVQPQTYRLPGDDSVMPLLSLVELETASKDLLRHLETVASSKQLQLIHLLRDGASPEETATELEIERSTLRVMRSDLRKKIISL
jgi:hypothetical protein